MENSGNDNGKAAEIAGTLEKPEERDGHTPDGDVVGMGRVAIGDQPRFLLDEEVEDRRWQEKSNCIGVDPDLFYPERGASTREAKGVCNGCEVKVDCLEYALRVGEKFGIWGGKSERERRRIRRQRALARRRPQL